MNILFFLEWYNHIKIKRKHLRCALESGYWESKSKSKKTKVQKELNLRLTDILTSKHHTYDKAIKDKIINVNYPIKKSNNLTYYLHKLTDLALITWDNEGTGEIKITKKGSMRLNLELSHAFLDRLYKDDEELLPKIPELLLLNKSNDFVKTYKWKTIENVVKNIGE